MWGGGGGERLSPERTGIGDSLEGAGICLICLFCNYYNVRTSFPHSVTKTCYLYLVWTFFNSEGNLSFIKYQ